MDATRVESTALNVVERMLHEGFATGNGDIVDELCSPDLIEHQFGLSGRGPEAIAKVKRGIADVYRGMPDIRFHVADWAENGDVVWVRAEVTATNTGPFFGPPTGKPVSFTVIDVARVQDGRIVEHWGVPDRFELLVRMGRMPQVGGEPSANDERD